MRYLITLRSGLNFWLALEHTGNQWRGLYAVTAFGTPPACQTDLYDDQDEAIEAAMLRLTSTGMEHVISIEEQDT